VTARSDGSPAQHCRPAVAKRAAINITLIFPEGLICIAFTLSGTKNDKDRPASKALGDNIGKETLYQTKPSPHPTARTILGETRHDANQFVRDLVQPAN